GKKRQLLQSKWEKREKGEDNGDSVPNNCPTFAALHSLVVRFRGGLHYQQSAAYRTAKQIGDLEWQDFIQYNEQALSICGYHLGWQHHLPGGVWDCDVLSLRVCNPFTFAGGFG